MIFFFQRHKRFTRALNSALVLIFAFSLITPVSIFAAETPTTLNIPKNIASIEKSFVGEAKKPVVFYIQDAHANFEAQENIAKLIDFLVKNQGVTQVFAEGFEGSSKLERIFKSVEAGRREKTARFFMDYLRLSGAQYAFLNRAKDFQFIGIEKLGDYLADLEAYKSGAENQKEIQGDLESMSKELRILANKIYPKEIKEWQKLRERFENKALSLADYLFRAMKLAPLGAGSYPHLGLVAEYLTKNKLSPEEAQILNTKLEAVDSRVFFGELKQFEKDFTGKFLTDKTAQKTFEYERAIALFEKLAGYSLTSEEYAELETNFKNLGTQEIADFLALNLKRSLVLSGRWENLIAGQRKFYELALKRDGNFAKAITSALSKPRPIIVVTGGFHKEGMTRFFEKEKVSYAVLSPKFQGTDPTHEKRYNFLMRGEYYPFEKHFFSPQASAQQPTLEILPEESTTSLVTTASRSLDVSGNVDSRLVEVYSKVTAVNRAVATASSLGSSENIAEGTFLIKSRLLPFQIIDPLYAFAERYSKNQITIIDSQNPSIQASALQASELVKFGFEGPKEFRVKIEGAESLEALGELAGIFTGLSDTEGKPGAVEWVMPSEAQGTSFGENDVSQDYTVNLEFQVESQALNPLDLAYALERFAADYSDYEIQAARPGLIKSVNANNFRDLIFLFNEGSVENFSVVIHGPEASRVADHLIAFLAELKDGNDRSHFIQIIQFIQPDETDESVQAQSLGANEAFFKFFAGQISADRSREIAEAAFEFVSKVQAVSETGHSVDLKNAKEILDWHPRLQEIFKVVTEGQDAREALQVMTQILTHYQKHQGPIAELAEESGVKGKSLGEGIKNAGQNLGVVDRTSELLFFTGGEPLTKAQAEEIAALIENLICSVSITNMDYLNITEKTADDASDVQQILSLNLKPRNRFHISARGAEAELAIKLLTDFFVQERYKDQEPLAFILESQDKSSGDFSIIKSEYRVSDLPDGRGKSLIADLIADQNGKTKNIAVSFKADLPLDASITSNPSLKEIGLIGRYLEQDIDNIKKALSNYPEFDPESLLRVLSIWQGKSPAQVSVKGESLGSIERTSDLFYYVGDAPLTKNQAEEMAARVGNLICSVSITNLDYLNAVPRTIDDASDVQQILSLKIDSKNRVRITARGEEAELAIKFLSDFFVEERPGRRAPLAFVLDFGGKSLGEETRPKLAPEKVVEARSVDLYVLNRELLALFAEYKNAKKQNDIVRMQAIIGVINQKAGLLNPYIQEIRGENPENQKTLDSFESRSRPDLKRLADELRERIDGYTPQFIQAQEARDSQTLDRLNREVVPLLKQRLKIQLLRTRYELSQPTTIIARQGPAVSILLSAVSIYHRISYEYWWRMRRARADEKISRFLMGDASGHLIYNLYYERQPMLKIERDGDEFYLTQNVWKNVAVEGGKLALVSEPTRVRFEESSQFARLEKALRSRIHALTSQEEDYRQLIYHDIVLEDIRRMLQAGKNQSFLPESLKEDVVTSLAEVLRGPDGQNGLARKKVRLRDKGGNPIPMPKENLESAIRLIQANDFKTAADLVESTRQWIHARLTDIENKKEGTIRKRDYVYLLIRDSAAIGALEEVIRAAQVPLDIERLRSAQLNLKTVEENYFKSIIKQSDYQTAQHDLRGISLALKTLVTEVERAKLRDTRDRVGLVKAAQMALDRLEKTMQSRLDPEERVVYKVNQIYRNLSELETGVQVNQPLDLKSEKGRDLLEKVVKSFDISRRQIQNTLFPDIQMKSKDSASRVGRLIAEVGNAIYQLQMVMQGGKTGQNPGTVESWAAKRTQAPKSLEDIKKDLILTRLHMENMSATPEEIDALFAENGAQLAQKMSGRSLGETPEKAKGPDLSGTRRMSDRVTSGMRRPQVVSSTVNGQVFQVRQDATNIKLSSLPGNLSTILSTYSWVRAKITNLDLTEGSNSADARNKTDVRLLVIQKGTRFKVDLEGQDMLEVENLLAMYIHEFADPIPAVGASLGKQSVDLDTIGKTIRKIEKEPVLLALSLNEYLAVSPAVQEELLTHLVAERIKLILTDAGDESRIPANLKIELERSLGRTRLVVSGLSSQAIGDLKAQNFIKKDELIIHLSKNLASTSSLGKSLGSYQKQFLFVKQEGQEPGTLTTAMLLAADKETYQRFFKRDASGFWVLSEFYELIKGLVQSFIGSQHLAQAA